MARMCSRPSRRVHRRASIALVAILCAAVAVIPARLAGQDLPVAGLTDSVAGGWRVFADKQCLQCHAVWGVGGAVGPDLGRSGRGSLTSGELVGTMWNHIPKVQAHVQRSQREFPRLDEREMSDLFSFLLFVRYLDEPGDPVAGQRVLREKGCATCHTTEGQRLAGAPDLKRWAGYTNPIVWAQKMWEHAPKMAEAMKEAGMSWPHLEDTDLMNIIAYLRSVGARGAKVYLEPGSVERGASLFVERKCRTCHHSGGIGKDLATTAPPRSLAAFASRMWNHSPEMTRAMQARGVERSPLSAQEMADIIAYVISLRHSDTGGDPQRGREIFALKQCGQCHLQERSADSPAPSLRDLGAASDPARLAPAMWNHGTSMMEQMSRIGKVWPLFAPGEMVDLIAYFRSIRPTQAIEAARPRVPVAVVPVRFRPPPIEAGAACASNTCHPGIIAGRVVHSPAAQGECGACHVLTDAAGHEFEYAYDDARLCYGCHDDSDDAAVRVAVGVCTACHDPHSANNLFGPGFTGGESCFADLVGMTVSLEELVANGYDRPVVAEDVPPVVGPAAAVIPAEKPGPPAAVTTPFVPATRPPISTEAGCVTAGCHDTMLFGRFQHGPAAQHQCDVCHRSTDEETHRFELVSSQPDLCFECHDRLPDTQFTHGPVALGLCTVCHDPHSAPNEFMLAEKGSEVCFMCHSEMGTHVRAASFPHGVIEEQGCTACHDPHGENHQYQLKGEPPQLCLDCHDSIGEIIADAAVPHEPVSTGKTCINCHDPHGSTAPNILVEQEMDLCLSCHNRAMETPHGSIIDMKSWFANNPEVHGPIRNGTCSPCHQPHGSQNFRILQHEFPPEFYRPFSLETYDLCFTCHEETLVLDERTTTLTGFRNGDKNLHFLHVNREKGRTCRACHEIHAGTKPKRIKDLVPFGDWAYPVNFEMFEHGGRCSPGCHTARGYDRRSEIIQE